MDLAEEDFFSLKPKDGIWEGGVTGLELVGLTGLEENLTRLRLVGYFLPKYIHSFITSSPEAHPLSSRKLVS